MDAAKIRVLLECLETGSMMRAADKLGYTPSGLTHMMDALERELGVEIIERGRYGIRLTRAGERLLPLLQEFTEAEHRLLMASRRLGQEESEVIRIGSYPSMARNWLPQIVQSFKEQYPNSQPEIVVLNRPRSYEALKSGQVDMLFACQNEKYDFIFEPLKKDYYKAVLPKGSYTARDGCFDMKDFETRPFIMPSYGRDQDVAQALEEHDVHPKQMAAYADNPVIVGMVAGGMGVSMMSEMILRGFETEVDILPIRQEVYRVIGIVYQSMESLTAAEKCFLAHVKRQRPK